MSFVTGASPHVDPYIGGNPHARQRIKPIVTFSPDIAERRFGYGLSGHLPGPASVAAMLNSVAGRDDMADQFPMAPFTYVQDKSVLRRRFGTYARANPDKAEGKEAADKARDILNEVREERGHWFAQTQLRRIHTQSGFRERLVAFWADHFTAKGSAFLYQYAETLYINEAVRAHIAGNFADLLISCVSHPMMLHYLDQDASVGPNSRYAKRRGNGRGLNENLAREVLELHTLGVNGPYDQADVRALAHVFTGMGRGRDQRFIFRNRVAEPGPQRLLGQDYSQRPSLQRIKTVLRDLAAHPATAAHIAQKLAVHFVADTPPPALVADLAATYLETGGRLMALYDVLLNHPTAWAMPATNIRPPLEFMSASLRALSVPQGRMSGLELRDINRLFLAPLKVMGQVWQKPAGPDGWAEEDAAWITPQGIAGRVEWAMRAPKNLLETLPDPREFVHHALGQNVPRRVAFAAKSAESRAEAIGLVLLSPAFQRR